MSIECEICDSTIYVPDSVWYAGTLFGPRRVTLCGSCASCIPIEEREELPNLHPYRVSFGPVSADMDTTRRWYSAAGAVNGPGRWFVSNEVIEKYLPNSKFLIDRLSPYCRMDEYVLEVVFRYLKEKESVPEARKKAIEAVAKYFNVIFVWFTGLKGSVNRLKEPGSIIGVKGETFNSSHSEKLLDELVEFIENIDSDQEKGLLPK
jgi:hypothetical protein